MPTLARATTVQISDIESHVISGKGAAPYHALLRNLSAPFGLASLLVHEETLNPGANNSRPHFHTRKEEMIVVLEGSLRVTFGDSVEEIGPGSIFGFPPGRENRHFVTNIGASNARYLSIGTVSTNDEVVFE